MPKVVGALCQLRGPSDFLAEHCDTSGAPDRLIGLARHHPATLSPEQSAIRIDTELVQVRVEDLGQLRWTRGPTPCPDLAVLQLPLLTLFTVVCPSTTSERGGAGEEQPASAVIWDVKVGLARLDCFARTQRGVVHAGEECDHPWPTAGQISHGFEQCLSLLRIGHGGGIDDIGSVLWPAAALRPLLPDEIAAFHADQAQRVARGSILPTHR
jgi:hypothetical protein